VVITLPDLNDEHHGVPYQGHWRELDERLNDRLFHYLLVLFLIYGPGPLPWLIYLPQSTLLDKLYTDEFRTSSSLILIIIHLYNIIEQICGYTDVLMLSLAHINI